MTGSLASETYTTSGLTSRSSSRRKPKVYSSLASGTPDAAASVRLAATSISISQPLWPVAAMIPAGWAVTLGPAIR
ncbi:hypothetical protein LQW54_006809 [Pestalotiopsis sp. IQ-011]